MAEASRQIDSVWYGAHSGKWYHMFTLQCSAGEPRFKNECCIHLSFGQFHLDPSLQWTIMLFFAPIQFYQSLGRRLFKTFKVFFLHKIKILEVFMFSPVYVSSLFCLTWAQRNAGECLVERGGEEAKHLHNNTWLSTHLYTAWSENQYFVVSIPWCYLDKMRKVTFIKYMDHRTNSQLRFAKQYFWCAKGAETFECQLLYNRSRRGRGWKSTLSSVKPALRSCAF